MPQNEPVALPTEADVSAYDKISTLDESQAEIAAKKTIEDYTTTQDFINKEDQSSRTDKNTIDGA